MGFHNILEHDGIGIAVAGMLIVFSALLTISVFIALLPTVLKSLSFVFPPEPEPAAALRPPPSDDDRIAAAIGFALHQRELQKQRTST